MFSDGLHRRTILEVSRSVFNRERKHRLWSRIGATDVEHAFMEKHKFGRYRIQLHAASFQFPAVTAT